MTARPYVNLIDLVLAVYVRADCTFVEPWRGPDSYQDRHPSQRRFFDITRRVLWLNYCAVELYCTCQLQQAGFEFRAESNTIQHILVVRRIAEKCKKSWSYAASYPLPKGL